MVLIYVVLAIAGREHLLVIFQVSALSIMLLVYADGLLLELLGAHGILACQLRHHHAGRASLLPSPERIRLD